MGQHAYQYEMFARSSATDANGAPALLTSDTDRDAQASLQHVVLTYDPVNGRRLYVNGNYTGDVDPEKGGTVGNWDDTFVFLLGNETSGNRKWQGTIRFAAVYNQALTQEQIQQNFAAGVGERYFLLFNVSALTGVSQAYVMFEVSRYDSYSYLFNKPTFISLDPAVKPGSIAIKGMRIGMNGAEARGGPGVCAARHHGHRRQLHGRQWASSSARWARSSRCRRVRTPTCSSSASTRSAAPCTCAPQPAAPQPATPADKPESSQLGVRVFSEINASLSEITGRVDERRRTSRPPTRWSSSSCPACRRLNPSSRRTRSASRSWRSSTAIRWWKVRDKRRASSRGST